MVCIMADNMPYSYASIKRNQIRLLKFVHHGASVAAVLKTFSLNEPLPPYHSLSYAWATDGTPPTRNWNMLINKQQLPVLDSLRPFCDALRSKGEPLGGRWWWIDSICINQADLGERAQQVKHMQHVYCHADQVITWLGQESSDSSMAMDFVRHLDKVSRKKYTIQQLRTMLQTDEYRPHWTALTNLLSRRWWSRIWTVQEFVLPSSISFWCGNRNVSRVALCRSIRTADRCTSTGIKESPGFTYGNNRRRAWALYKVMKKAEASVTLSLPALAAYFSCMDATDDLDRLYGLMGLCTDKPLLSVNYLLSTREVYLRFAQAFIMRHKSLDIISFASIYDSPGDSSWPTWVPRWRTDSVLVIPLMVSQSSKTLIGNLRTPAALEVDPSISYSASGTMEATSQFEGSTLLCQGVMLDTVDGLAGSRHSQMVQSSTWSFMQTSYSDCSLSPTDILASVCRSLVLDRKDRYLRHTMPAEFCRDFVHLLAPLITGAACSVPEELKDWFSWVTSLQIQGHSFESILRESLQASVDTPDYAPNQDEFYHSTFFGRFFDTVMRMSMRLMVTRCGHIGMATGKAIKGDFVCILLGCSVPVILRQRKDEEGFTFVVNVGRVLQHIQDANWSSMKQECDLVHQDRRGILSDLGDPPPHSCWPLCDAAELSLCCMLTHQNGMSTSCQPRASPDPCAEKLSECTRETAWKSNGTFVGILEDKVSLINVMCNLHSASIIAQDPGDTATSEEIINMIAAWERFSKT
ncbi:hypothetical protein F66182_2290 [Fusarium sp. NRRL 66182]|nr:hypothetical protein F66182_2290 [Fusarium sp. NRRL 66182]